MMAVKTALSIGEQIDRAIGGKIKQGWIVRSMKDLGIDISEVQFSRKKKGHEQFTEQELKTLSEILGTQITLS